MTDDELDAITDKLDIDLCPRCGNYDLCDMCELITESEQDD